MIAEPLDVRNIDLSIRQCDVDGGQSAVLTIFWWKNLPLGARASLPQEPPLTGAHLRQLAAEYAAAQLAARDKELGGPLRASFEGWPKPKLSLAKALQAEDLINSLDKLAGDFKAPTEGLSVVICTRNRREGLARTLKSVAAQRSPPGETVVVDNSKDANARPACSKFPNVRYIHEPRLGLSVARNTGLRACSGELIAFTDDDVELHPRWTVEIAHAFATRDVDAITGLILPARLDTAAQRFFQFTMGAFGTMFVPAVFERHFFEETRPGGAHVWKIGAGANMAFRRSVFERHGLFDERLGAGAAGCSEDSELWYRLLAGGGSCLFEPRVAVFHHHRTDWKGLRRQIRHYMRGHVAALIVQYDSFHDRGSLVRIGKQLPLYFMKTAINLTLQSSPGRATILIEEMLGYATGLHYAFRPGWRRRRASSLPTSSIAAGNGVAA